MLRRMGCLLLCLQVGLAVARGWAQASAENGNSDLAVEAVRKALASERAAIAAHPRAATPYIQLAYTLSDAGMNDRAVEAMRKATEVEPTSSLAFSAQAWIERHNTVGVDFGKGFDYDAAVASYLKAIALDPADMAVRQSLANVYEHDRRGMAYASGAKLGLAIEQYRYVKAHEAHLETEVEENLVIALFYSGLFQEALDEMKGQPTTPKLDGVAIAAIAAVRGSPAGIAFANEIEGPDAKKKDALEFGAEGLWNMRLYGQAADILTASLPNPGSTGIAARIQLFRQLKPYQHDEFPESDPRRPVRRLLEALIFDEMEASVLAECISSHAVSPDTDWKTSSAEQMALAGKLRSLSRQTGLPAVVMQDILLGSLKVSLVPSREPGSRVKVELAGQGASSFFVLKEEQGYRIVGTSEDSAPVGAEALYLLRSGREAEAAALLNWEREFTPREQGDDPLGGSLFSRLWQANGRGGRDAMELAAASLDTDATALGSLLPKVIAADEKASGEMRAVDDLLLAKIYLRLKRAAEAEAIVQKLLSRYPDSPTAAELAGEAYRQTGRLAAWRELARRQLALHPDDRPVLLQNVKEAKAEGDYRRALESARRVLDGGHAEAEDYDLYGRLSVFAGLPDERALEAAQQANLMSRRTNAHYLATAAWLHASLGNTAQARELLLEAMNAGGLDEPDGEVWFGFGRIYEQYGENDAAAAAYRRVGNGKNSAAGVDVAVQVLARSRLAALHLQ